MPSRQKIEFYSIFSSRRYAETFSNVKEKKLPRDFYDRAADQVAPDLIGKILCVRHGSRILRSRILETEAYLGQKDKACHASKGLTKRTSVMFGPPGYAYVYLIYGMYEMLNVVTHSEGEAHAVLIRAAEPIYPKDLRLDGPGKLTKHLKITRRLNAADLCGEDIYILDSTSLEPIVRTPRIGVEYAKDWAKKPLRYIWKAAPHFSLQKKS